MCSSRKCPPQAPGSLCSAPSLGVWWSETCGAWSPRPAPGALGLGPDKLCPGRRRAPPGLNLGRSGGGALGWTGPGPGCGAADPGTLAPPPADALGAPAGGCLGGRGVSDSALQHGHFLFAALPGPRVPLPSVLLGVRFEGVGEALTPSGFARGSGSESGTREGGGSRGKAAHVPSAPSYSTPPLLPFFAMPVPTAARGSGGAQFTGGPLSESSLTRFLLKVSLKRPLYLVFSLQGKSLRCKEMTHTFFYPNSE